MNYHNEIMNLPVTKVMSEIGNIPDMILYKEGFRDARHAAAEIALQADERIAELEDALQEILYVHANDAVRPNAFYIAQKALAKSERK